MKTLYESILSSTKSGKENLLAKRIKELGWEVGDVIVEDIYSNHKRHVFFWQITELTEQEKDSVIAEKLVTVYYRDYKEEHPIKDSFKLDKYYPAANKLLFQFKSDGSVRRTKVSVADVWKKRNKHTHYYKWKGGDIPGVDFTLND